MNYYIITKFSQMDSLPNFLTHGAPLCARFARARSSAINILLQTILIRPSGAHQCSADTRMEVKLYSHPKCLD